MNNAIEEKRELSLKKHVAAIHAANPLTLIQRKLANALLYHAYQNLLADQEHIISIRELCDLIGFESHAIEQVKTALKKLMSTVIEWNLIDKEKENKENYWVASTILASVVIKGGECRYTYSKHLRELLFQPEIFASLDMAVLKSFKSSYGLALYENCMRFKNVKQTGWIEIPVFRKLMGVAEEKYSEFSDFKRRVIEAAVQEVNQNNLSRIILTPEFKQEGRAVKAIKFHISDKESATPLKITLAEDEKILSFLVEKLGIELDEGKSLVDKYGATYVVDKVNYLTSTKTFLSGEMSYPLQYLKKALQEDYKPVKSSKDLLWEAKRKKEEEEENKRIKGKRQEEFRVRYSNYRTKFIMQKFSVIAEKEKKELTNLFVKESSEAPVIQNLINRSGFESPFVRSQFVTFLTQHKADLLEGLLSFDNYINQQDMAAREENNGMESR